jgi:predicted ATP-grasp superfamily ATP-dependent carboligase
MHRGRILHPSSGKASDKKKDDEHAKTKHGSKHDHDHDEDAPMEPAPKPKKERPVDLVTWKKNIENRQKVLFEHNVGDITLREYDNIDVDGAYLLEGFPSEGITAILTAQFFTEALNLPLVGDILSDAFPPTCAVKNYFPSQACRIHGNKQLVVFVSEFSLTPEVANNIVHVMFEFARRHRMKGIITTDGFPAQAATDDDDDDDSTDPSDPLSNLKVRLGAPHNGSNDANDDDDEDGDDDDDGGEEVDAEEMMAKLKQISLDLDKPIEPEQVRFLTNSIALGEKCLANKHRPLENAVIQGVTGGLLADMMLRETDVLCLLSPFNPMLSTDTKGGLVLSRSIMNIIGLEGVDTSKLESRVSKLERKIKKAIERIAGPNALGKLEAPSSMYM